MKLEMQLRRKIESQHKADATADAYWGWVKRFLLFARARRGEWVHPIDMGERQVAIFLSHLATEEGVSANTQNQAFSALCYLYRHVLNQPLEGVSALRAKRPDAIREVLDQSEIVALFEQLFGVALLTARMMYASSFRIGEVGRIRIKDISFERKQIVVRRGKGEKDRVVGFPQAIHDTVSKQIESTRRVWMRDMESGGNGVSLPKAFGKKSPRSHKQFRWYYLLCSNSESRCPKSGRLLRHHRHMGSIARQISNAADRAGIEKRVTSHCLRHSFATHSIESGVPIHFVQKLMGHASIETTERYLHASKDKATSSTSPIEAIAAAELEERLANPPASEARQPRLRVYAG